jgi:hypothetical protein
MAHSQFIHAIARTPLLITFFAAAGQSRSHGSAAVRVRVCWSQLHGEGA